jgi:hypothetical protein
MKYLLYIHIFKNILRETWCGCKADISFTVKCLHFFDGCENIIFVWLLYTVWHLFCNFVKNYNSLPQYNWNIVESGIKHHNPNPFWHLQTNDDKPMTYYDCTHKKGIEKQDILTIKLFTFYFCFSLMSIKISLLQ